MSDNEEYIRMFIGVKENSNDSYDSENNSRSEYNTSDDSEPRITSEVIQSQDYEVESILGQSSFTIPRHLDLHIVDHVEYDESDDNQPRGGVELEEDGSDVESVHRPLQVEYNVDDGDDAYYQFLMSI